MTGGQARRRAALLGSLALAGCPAPAPPAPPPVDIAPAQGAPPRDDGASRLIQRVLRRVEASRKLPALAPVKGVVLDRPALLALAQKQSSSDVPPEVLRAQSVIMQALGWIPPGYDLDKGSQELLEAQLAGFYDPESKTMYLSSDQPAQESEATLAHELVHALQDQHHDLLPRFRYRPEAGDEPSAVHALAEGDATSAMTDVLLADKNIDALSLPQQRMIDEMEAQTMASAPGVPPLLRASLIAPYTDGLRFVHALRRRGGWAEVDRAWKNPPVTTEQLLHLDKYDAREAPLPVPRPPTSALGGGFRVVLSDQLGEQTLRLVLGLVARGPEAREGAAGWGGDRIALMARSSGGQEELFVTWWIRFDGAAARCPEASEAHELLGRGFLPQRGGTPQGPLCRERPDLGPTAMAISGCDILIAAGPFEKQGETWKSKGACDPLKAWIQQAVRQP